MTMTPSWALFARVGQVLQGRCLKVRTGTILDATIIGAPSSTKNVESCDVGCRLLRLADVTASAFRRPPLTCSSAPGIGSNRASTFPPAANGETILSGLPG